MQGLVVKPAEYKDIDALIEILSAAVKYKLQRGDDAWATVQYTTEKLEKRIKDGSLFSAWVSDILIGTIQLSQDDELIWGKQPAIAAYVHQLAIKDSYHGRNFGKALLDWANDEAKMNGYVLLRIDIPPSNKALKNYYESHGFVWVMDRQIRVPWGTYDASLYERQIN